MTESRLIPVFMPALVVLLVRAEEAKGNPLSEQEVLDIRDKGICVMMPAEHYPAITEKRGYDDIDPEHAWAQWQQARVEIIGP